MKTHKVRTLPDDITGKGMSFKAGRSHQVFKIIRGQWFPYKKISNQHRDYLTGLREGMLVSVTFHGQPVPLVRLYDGVVRLIEVETKGETLKGSRNISEALGVTVTRQPVAVQQI